MELLYRDEFSVHDRDDRARGGAFRGALQAVRAQLLRPRRFSPEVAFWAVIVVLLILFVAVLITGQTGVARGGR